MKLNLLLSSIVLKQRNIPKGENQSFGSEISMHHAIRPFSLLLTPQV